MSENIGVLLVSWRSLHCSGHSCCSYSVPPQIGSCGFRLWEGGGWLGVSSTFEIGSDEYQTASDRRDKRRYRACQALPSLINNAGQKKMREATRPFQPFKKLLSSLVAEVRYRCECSIFLRRGYCIRGYFLCIQASRHPIIRDLYYTQSLTLEQTRRIMHDEHDFHASARCCKGRIKRECTPERWSRQLYQAMATVLQAEPRSLGTGQFEAWRGGQRISLTPQCVVKETQRLRRKRPGPPMSLPKDRPF